MVKATGIIRTYPAGAVVVGRTVTIRDELTDSTITTDSTDSGGRWDYEANGSEGPWYWGASDATPDPDVYRWGSSLVAGSGGAYSLYELPDVLRAMGDGVVRGYLDELEVTDPDSGLELDYAAGAALVQGIPVHFGTAGTHTITTNQHATQTKACYLCIQLTGKGDTEEGKAVLVDTCGAAAASPELPALTQDATTWQHPLATFVLGIDSANNANDVTDVTDVRSYVLERHPTVSSVVRRVDPASTTTTTSTTGEALTSLTTTVTLLDDVVYDIEARATAAVKISSAASTVSIAPYIDGVGNIAPYIASTATDHTLLGNTYTLEGVTGTGAAINCGVRWKVSAGTGTASTGTLAVIARPRS